MVEIDNIFGALVRGIPAEGPEVSPGARCATGGCAASSLLLTAISGRAVGFDRMQVSAESSGYEGQLKQNSQAQWVGMDVVGSHVGAKMEDSGLVVGYVVCAAKVNDEKFPAVRIGSLESDEENAWYTGEEIEHLASVFHVDTSAVDMQAMSNFAKLGVGYDGVNPRHEPLLGETILVLDGLYSSVSEGDLVVAEVGGGVYLGLRVLSSGSAQIAPVGGVVVPVTEIAVRDESGALGELVDSKIRIWFNAKKAGTLERIPTKTVTKADFLNTPRPVTLTPPATLPTQTTPIIIEDAEGTALQAEGAGELIDGTPHITITKLLDEDFDGELVKPIIFMWGLTRVTRGRTVNREIIGSGDATQGWQSFRLAKSPLTYVADPHAPNGRRPELEVYVNGVKWRRAQSFYGAGPQDELYVIRHDAEHQTFIQFGDGELGKRLPTGFNNVIATYRFGVGGNVEANTITKLVRPIRGVSSIRNPLPATGGEDPPTPRQARARAIQSTRVLGRLVSLVDFEVEAARYGGVVRAKARWDWDKASEDAVVKVWIICADAGDPSTELRTYLSKMAEPGVRVQVHKASKDARELSLDLEIDPNHLPDEVWAAVDERLFEEFEGLLAPRNTEIGGSLYRSELFAAIHEVEGVLAVEGVLVDGEPMAKAITVAEGYYLALAHPDAG